MQIGNDHTVEVTPALSLDAGYTRGDGDGATLASFKVADTPENTQQLKVLAEACLNNGNPHAPDPETCYVTGRVLAAKENPSKSGK